MKRVSLLIVLMVASVVGGYAQEANIFGIKAGVNIANMSWKTNGVGFSMDSKIGYYTAFSYERLIRAGLPLYFETGMSFASYGTEMELPASADSYQTVRTSITTHYMQLPVMLNCHLMVNSDFGIIPRFGFNLGAGLSGQAKTSGLIGDMVIDDDDPMEGDAFGDDGLKRFDIGLCVGLDFMYKRVTLGFTYDAGLMNISNMDNISGKNNAWTIALGYKF